MLILTTTLLFLVLAFYIVYGGIDLGHGVLEFFTNKHLDKRHDMFVEHKQDRRYTASHILILCFGLAFLLSFPTATRILLNIIFYPLFFLLLGILLRALFAYRLRKKRKLNALISLWTTFWFGIVSGALLQDSFDVDYLSKSSFFITPFTLTVACFLGSLFAYVAAVFSISNSPTRLIQAKYKKRAIIANLCAVIFGGLLLSIAFYYPEGITFYFLQDNFSMSCMLVSTLLLIPHWIVILKDKKEIMKIIAVIQLMLILFGIVSAQYPMILQIKQEITKIYTLGNSFDFFGSLWGSLILILGFFSFIIIRKMFPTWRRFPHHSEQES
jgi:cytochrome bd-type quinol oxidase subunit 2